MSARAARAVPGLLVAVAVASVCVANGGFFPTEWGWAALGGLVVCLVSVLVREQLDVGPLDVVLVGALAAYAAWTAVSIVWAPSPALPVLEVERLLVYVGAAAGLVLVARRRDEAVLALGVLAAVTAMCAYALATRLVPDHFGTFSSYPSYLLTEPLGYSNALGLLAAMAMALSVGVVTHAERSWQRAAGGAAATLLALAWYFTFSRGATGAIVLALGVAFALDPRRLRFSVAALALAPAVAAELLVATRSHALTHRLATLSAAAREGHRLLVVLVVACAANAAVAAALDPRRDVAPRIRRAYVAALAALTVVLVAGAVVRVGNPIAFVSRATDAFRGSNAPSSNLNDRLFTLSSDSRSDYWNVAWRQYRGHPLLGSGAGTYGRYWLRYRPIPFGARNAHNQYLETLAELGPVGLALLLAALAAPLVALRRARREPLLAATGGAYVAFLAVLALDWDWQLTGVGLAGLACGVALVVAARPGRSFEPPIAVRSAVVAVAVTLALFALVGQLGNNALRSSARATARGQAARGAHLARQARRWAPWSYQPWHLLGEAELRAGDERAARGTLRQAVARDRGDWGVWYDLALASRGEARRRALAAARRLNPVVVARIRPKE